MAGYSQGTTKAKGNGKAKKKPAPKTPPGSFDIPRAGMKPLRLTPKPYVPPPGNPMSRVKPIPNYPAGKKPVMTPLRSRGK